MKGKMKKSLTSMFLALSMVFMLGFSCFAANDKALSEDEINNFKTVATQLVEQVTSFTDEQMEQLLSQDDEFTNAALLSWTNAKDELGAYKEVGEQEVETDGNNVIITSDVTFESKTASVEVIADTKEGAFVSMTFNVNYSFAEKLAQAGMNTVMGLGVVFLILIFLSFIISQFKHIGGMAENLTKKEEAPKAPAPAAQAALAEEEEELCDDGELVAVIAAAVAAYEGTSADGFVVRSIKKSNSRKWKRA